MDRALFSPDRPDTTNAAGGAGYAMDAPTALATIACTGFLGQTFYVSAAKQLNDVVTAARGCPDDWVAKVARYARHRGFMKDMPAVLVAYLYGKRSPLFEETFEAVIDNAKMLSNFVMAVRSGQFDGRRNLSSSRGRKAIQRWFDKRSAESIFRASVAKNPSIADILKLAHIRPNTDEKRALFGHLLGLPVDNERLPPLVRETLMFRRNRQAGRGHSMPVPDVPFNMVDSVPLTMAHWAELFERGGLQFTRMNLRTAHRHGVFQRPEVVNAVVKRLTDPEEVQRSRQFPYQMLTSWYAVREEADMPAVIKQAMATATELSLRNVPALEGNVYVAVDMSGSMFSPVTGRRTAMKYADVAALFAAAIHRSSPNVRVITFDTDARLVPLDPTDSLAAVTQRLTVFGGGTDTSAPLRLLNAEQRDVDLYILISDMESWVDPYSRHFVGSMGPRTSTLDQWNFLKRRNPHAKQVLINIEPNAVSQSPPRKDTLQVAGFSDAVFDGVANWYKNMDPRLAIEQGAG